MWYLQETLRQRAGDSAEGIADLGTQQTHNSNDNDSDEGENNRVLNQTLTFFLRSEQHDSDSFLNKVFFSEVHPQAIHILPKPIKPARIIPSLALQSCYVSLTRLKITVLGTGWHSEWNPSAFSYVAVNLKIAT